MAALSSRPAAPAPREALAAIADGAAERDRHPAFPTEALEALGRCGLLGLTVPAPGGARPLTWAEEWAAVRAVARADGSVGRIYDGHLNAVERLAALAPEPLRSTELLAIAAGERWLGVWGADPLPSEGEPARVVDGGDGPTLRGAKVFCSGAGGLHRAAVLVRAPEGGAPLLAYVDLSRGVEVDPFWYRGPGLRASESHRVTFHDCPVLALLGGPGELAREPLFGRDAVRTAATWSGIADAAAEDALALLAARPETSDLEAFAAGRIGAARAAIDAWLGEAARRAEADPAGAQPEESVHLRSGVAGACRTILDEAARGCGSRPFATGSTLDRARRDLDVFLLQHRLDPLLARAGHAAIAAHRADGAPT